MSWERRRNIISVFSVCSSVSLPPSPKLNHHELHKPTEHQLHLRLLWVRKDPQLDNKILPSRPTTSLATLLGTHSAMSVCVLIPATLQVTLNNHSSMGLLWGLYQLLYDLTTSLMRQPAWSDDLNLNSGTQIETYSNCQNYCSSGKIIRI